MEIVSVESTGKSCVPTTRKAYLPSRHIKQNALTVEVVFAAPNANSMVRSSARNLDLHKHQRNGRSYAEEVVNCFASLPVRVFDALVY